MSPPVGTRVPGGQGQGTVVVFGPTIPIGTVTVVAATSAVPQPRVIVIQVTRRHREQTHHRTMYNILRRFACLPRMSTSPLPSSKRMSVFPSVYALYLTLVITFPKTCIGAYPHPHPHPPQLSLPCNHKMYKKIQMQQIYKKYNCNFCNVTLVNVQVYGCNPVRTGPCFTSLI